MSYILCSIVFVFFGIILVAIRAIAEALFNKNVITNKHYRYFDCGHFVVCLFTVLAGFASFVEGHFLFIPAAWLTLLLLGLLIVMMFGFYYGIIMFVEYIVSKLKENRNGSS